MNTKQEKNNLFIVADILAAMQNEFKTVSGFDLDSDDLHMVDERTVKVRPQTGEKHSKRVAQILNALKKYGVETDVNIDWTSKGSYFIEIKK